MKIGVTGISSTLGAALVEELVKLDQVEEIIGLDIRFRNFLDHPKITFLKGDVRNRDQLAEAFQGVDVLIHLAFIVVENVPDFETTYDINVNGSKTVFATAAELRIPKIVYTSSVAAYGVLPDLPIPITEDAPIRGNENKHFYYALTKATVANFLDIFEQDHPEILITRFRPHVIAGPKFNEMTGNMNTSLKQMVRTDRPYISLTDNNRHNPPKCLQYTDERDLVKVIIYASTHDFPGVYNITGEPLDLYGFLKERGQTVRKIPIGFVVALLSIGGIFSKRLATLKTWAKISRHPVIVSSEKLLASGYPYSLNSTKDLVLESLDNYDQKHQQKLHDREASNFSK